MMSDKQSIRDILVQPILNTNPVVRCWGFVRRWR